MKAKKRYLQPHFVNSAVWFYKSKNSFEFIIGSNGRTRTEAMQFRVQDRTLLNFISGKAKDVRNAKVERKDSQ